MFAGSTTIQGLAAVKLHLPTCEKHTLCRAEQWLRPPLSWMLGVTTSEADGLQRLLQIRAAAGICIQRFRRSDSELWVAVEGAACDIICGEKAIQARVKLLLPTTPSSSPVLEDPKLGLAPHLLPLIRWIASFPPNSINFFSPQLLLASITHNTLQVIYTDY